MTLILGLETSCDETAAAVVDENLRVRSNVVATQFDLHQRYAGVVPEIASRAHLEKILPVVEQALHNADVPAHQLHAIAVGHRPGLIGSLIVGVAAAKALAWSLRIPILGVDHVQAHLTAAALQTTNNDLKSEIKNQKSSITHPALGLVVSGGHTSLYRITHPPHADADADAESLPGAKRLVHPPQPTRLGATIDDAVGEAFDKAAVILGIGYPGGPRIDTLAKTGNPLAVKLPRPLLDKHSLDFSFSGLKTALLYAVRGHPVGRGKSAAFQRDHTHHHPQAIADFAASFQAAAVDVLITKLNRALQQQPAPAPYRSLILGGGVSANSQLRSRVQDFAHENNLTCHLPDPDFCIDNAAMIAGHAHTLLAQNLTANLSLPVIATTRA